MFCVLVIAFGLRPLQRGPIRSDPEEQSWPAVPEGLAHAKPVARQALQADEEFDVALPGMDEESSKPRALLEARPNPPEPTVRSVPQLGPRADATADASPKPDATGMSADAAPKGAGEAEQAAEGTPWNELFETWAQGLRVSFVRAKDTTKKAIEAVVGQEQMRQLEYKFRNWTEIAICIGVAICLCLVLVGGMVCHVARRPTAQARRVGLYSIAELSLMTSFRFYGGLLVMSWLPFLLVHESKRFWPAHKTLFMGICKAMMGVAMGLSPIFGYLNDRTQHRWGRRRFWFLCGVTAVCVAIVVAALSSAYNWPAWVYVLTVIVWMLGESAADSTAEALVPDLCTPHDYNAAAAVRSVSSFLGSLVGCILIILLSILQLDHHWLYVTYLLAVGLTAPWTIMYAVPKETEMETAQTELRMERSLDSVFYQCYWKVLNASTAFRNICASVFLFTFSMSSACYLFWFLADVINVDETNTPLHFGSLAITFFAGACGFSFCMSLLMLPEVKSAQVMIFMYAVLDMCQPAAVLMGSSMSAKLGYIYILAFLRGCLFGGVNNLMQTLVWDAIPAEWKAGVGATSRMMAFVAVCRCVAAGLGNLIAGMVLDWSTAWSTEEGKYPVVGFVALHFMCAAAGLCSVWTVGKIDQDAPALPSKGSDDVAMQPAG